LSDFYSKIVHEYFSNSTFASVVDSYNEEGNYLEVFRKKAAHGRCLFSTVMWILAGPVLGEIQQKFNLSNAILTVPWAFEYLTKHRHIHEVEYVGDTVYVSSTEPIMIKNYLCEVARLAGMNTVFFDDSPDDLPDDSPDDFADDSSADFSADSPIS
jgi:hypothetical protein